jgi:spermidine synthase
MNSVSAPPVQSSRSVARHLPFLLLLFIGSGCAALIYEIVWFQLLQLVIGSSAVSLAVLLGTFMGGMCLGSLALPRLVSARYHPLRVYAVLELGIALAALGVAIAVPIAGHLYTSMLGHGMPGILLRALICAGCLLPPTVLMGATLPAIARGVETTPRGVSWLGYFYGGNTVGAVVGCLLAGFYLLRLHDVMTATYCAVALNVIVALLALMIARFAPYQPVPTPEVTPAPAPGRSQTSGPVLLSIGISGFCALASEVIWARNLSLLLGATVYTFSIILAVFLTGLGLGSSTGAALSQRIRRPRLALACCQVLQVATIAWAAYAIALSLPFWTMTELELANPWMKFRGDLLRCAWAILPAAVLWGASFPLALAATTSPGGDAARSVGQAYAANTLGAIGGAVLASMLLIPALGTQHAQVALIVLSLVSALIVYRPRGATGSLIAGIAVIAVMLVSLKLPRIPWELVAYGRQIATTDYGSKSLFFGEGMNSSVAVSETPDGSRFFHVAGKTEASSLEKDMRLQRMLGHIPALLHPNPKSVLIVGCGAGVTAGTFIVHPSIERIVICDIEPLIPRVVAEFFSRENYDVLRSPRVEVVYDDARHFIATTTEKFDIITSDPIHPWVKGSAVLYSKEYFELCRARLNPGGLVTQWVPFYESDRAVVQSEIATFFSVFPEGTIWGNDDEGYGYDTVMLGQEKPLLVDLPALQQRLQRPDHARVVQSLNPLALGTPLQLLSTYAGRYADLRTWLAGAEINRDRNLRLQYLAGMQLDSLSGSAAYNEMLRHRVFPFDIFQAPESQLETLRLSMESRLAQ